jgi:uncharacterized SAM-binding protein YcdF (DUF218 family)
MLTDQLTMFNLLLFLGIIGTLLRVTKRKRLSNVFLIFTLILFLLSSSSLLPEILAKSLESRYPSITISTDSPDQNAVYIYVLAAGYSPGRSASATKQLNLTSLGRLAEGIRLHGLVSRSIIVTSGYSSIGAESQASVTKRAAVELGVSDENVMALETAGNTEEEAIALKRTLGTNIKMILVTDAIHLPRAMKIFESKGFRPIPAPANFRTNDNKTNFLKSIWPSVQNISLTDQVLHEYLGILKHSLIDKQE